MSDASTITRDPMVELLRQQLAGGQDGAEASPALGMLGEYLEQRRQALEEDLERQQAVEELQREEDLARAERLELVRTARAQIEALAAEVDALRSRVDRLAAAVGACPECWGEDAGCRWCRGRGRPGFIPPDPQEFALIVVPAIRMQARLMKHRTDKIDRAQRVTDEEGRSS